MQETTEEIEFRDQQEAYAILGDRDTLLQSMQENFSCRMVSRGGSLRPRTGTSLLSPAGGKADDA